MHTRAGVLQAKGRFGLSLKRHGIGSKPPQTDGVENKDPPLEEHGCNVQE